MSQVFFTFLNQFNPLSDDSIQAIAENLNTVHLPKGTVLVQEGKICDYLFYLEKGSVRGYTNVDEKEITYWFGFEDTMITSFHSFISRQPVHENIVLMEDSVLTSIHYTDLHKLYDLYPDIERAGRRIIEKYYVLLEERTFSYMFKTAKERYESLLASAPHILLRVPLGYIASYLGISQETLSRIRGKI